MLLFVVIANIILAVALVKTKQRLRSTQKLLDDAYRNTHATPIKELAANFRDFVEGIDGKVSPEVEEAIKKLEESEGMKALPAPKSGTAAVKPKNKPKKRVDSRPVMSSEVWNLFAIDMNASGECEEKVEVVRRWGKKYIFPLDSQVQIIKVIDDSDERETLRDYFEQNHKTKVISA